MLTFYHFNRKEVCVEDIKQLMPEDNIKGRIMLAKYCDN